MKHPDRQVKKKLHSLIRYRLYTKLYSHGYYNSITVERVLDSKWNKMSMVSVVKLKITSYTMEKNSGLWDR